MSTPSIFRLKKSRNLEKSHEGDAIDSSSISRLPDEIILQILNKIIDLKTLCFCYLVSKRFSSIVLEVDAISSTCPLLNPCIPDKNTVVNVAPNRPFPPFIFSYYGESFVSAYRFLRKFKGVKSLSIERLSSSHSAVNNRFFKWKVKFESIMFLSPNSVFQDNEIGDEGENKKAHSRFMFVRCVRDVMARHTMLLYLVKDLLMLEEVSITDSGRRGWLSLSGEKLSEVKEWVHTPSETLGNRVEVPDIVSYCYSPFLNFRGSWYMTKETPFRVRFSVTEMKEDLQGEKDVLMNSK